MTARVLAARSERRESSTSYPAIVRSPRRWRKRSAICSDSDRCQGAGQVHSRLRAPGKGNTTNYCGSARTCSSTVDRNPHKWGMFLPAPYTRHAPERSRNSTGYVLILP